MKKITIIIVSYRSAERVVEFVKKQLPKIRWRGDIEVVIVNNASTFEECLEIAGLCGGVACRVAERGVNADVVVLHSPDNLGYAKGNNLGVEFVRGNGGCDYLLFSNDDIILDDNVDIDLLVNRLDSDPMIGAVGPDVIGLDGLPQSPHRRVITPYRQIGWKLFRPLKGLKLRIKKKRQNVSDLGIESAECYTPEGGWCYWVSGSFFMMRMSDFTAVDGFDPATFLYSEEVIMAERLKKIGKRMFFEPNVRVVHMEGGTTGKISLNKGMQRILKESNCHYYKKYLKSPRLVIWLYKKL